ncbi:potassium-transporting ATPase subunit F [Nocardia arthritidis]|uniref:Potassium-transporting ATPase subunit F n=1 Tax=Nocardia arthritidis TaxID=228602 RepID=A0A6G9YN71_9NOCA|nr:potassium-transporting ATPase subunit F [Nocardia arthritidis]
MKGVCTHVCGRVHGGHRGRLRPVGPHPARGGATVTENIIGLVLGILIAVYLVAALLAPERF